MNENIENIENRFCKVMNALWGTLSEGPWNELFDCFYELLDVIGDEAEEEVWLAISVNDRAEITRGRPAGKFIPSKARLARKAS